MIELKSKVEKELLEDILPFWIHHTVDYVNGGFYGKIHNDLYVDKEAPKGGVLNARILWTFSAAYRIYKKKEYLDMAQRAYSYITLNFWDTENGGIYWLVDKYGKPLDTKKQIYAQAFAIYGLSEFYRATGNETALSLATLLFGLIEKHSYDPVYKGYFESCDREWHISDGYLDGKCGSEKKSMNTMLHVMEGYTSLYRVWKDDLLKNRLKEIILVTMEHIIDKETGHFKLFFDEKWHSLKDGFSYGHDIEGSWLLHESAEVLGDLDVLENVKKLAVKMADTTLGEGMAADGSILYEGHLQGSIIKDRHWWPQAEGVIGFFNAYQLTGRMEFLEAAKSIWNYIAGCIIDKEHGEWFWGRTSEGRIMEAESKVDIWKCPYHNSRVCMEIAERVISRIGPSSGTNIIKLQRI